MWQRKCPNQLDWTLNRPYPASYLLQVHLISDWNHVWIKQVIAWKIHSKRVGMLMFLSCGLYGLKKASIQRWITIVKRWQWKCLTWEMRRFRNLSLSGLVPKSLNKAKQRQDTLFMTKLHLATWPRCYQHHVQAPLCSKPKGVFPLAENASDRDNLMLSATCLKEQLWTISGPDISDIVHSSY